jgi:two-component system, LytTR family, sensor kinase
VKHNILSREQPLVIDIFTTAGNKLVVSNNLQRRNVQKFSNKIGLRNIEQKYELLGQHGFHVLEDVKNFCVVLPLIWSKNLKPSFIQTPL